MGPSPTRGRTNGHLPLILLALAAAKLAAAQKQQQQQPNQSYFSPPMAAVVVVLVTAFFLLGFFSIYIRRCAGNPLGGPDYPTQLVGPMTLASASRSRRHRGLDTAVLETFPTMAYADVKAHKAGKAALECAVCLSEFDDDETLRLLPKCSHVFHPDCIDAWLASHVTCPVCRANLVPDPSAPATAPTTEPLDTAATQQPVQEVAPTSASAAPERVAVVIDVEETEEDRVRREEAAELMRIGSLKRALRSKSGRQPARLPRSHSTGHSPAAPASDKSADRFTLKLPEHVLREIVEAGKLQRTTSLLAFRAGRQGSTRRGSRVGEGSSRAMRSVRLGRSDRWPSFVVRTFSAKFPAWGSVRRAADDGSSNLRKVAGAGAGAVAGNAVECDDQACTLGRRV